MNNKGIQCSRSECPQNKGVACRYWNCCIMFRAMPPKPATAQKTPLKRESGKARAADLQRKYIPKEIEEQEMLARYLDGLGVMWWHTPNERRASVGEMVKLQKQGLKKGVPDNFIAVARGRFFGLFIELKRQKKSLSRVSKEQQAIIDELNKQGYKAVVAYGAAQAIATVINYLKGE